MNSKLVCAYKNKIKLINRCDNMCLNNNFNKIQEIQEIHKIQEIYKEEIQKIQIQVI